MDLVIKDLQQNKEKASTIIEAAEERKTALLASTHIEAKKNIAGINEINKQKLKEMEEDLKQENDKKEQDVIAETTQIIAKMEANGVRHHEELVDLLFRTVTTVEVD